MTHTPEVSPASWPQGRPAYPRRRAANPVMHPAGRLGGTAALRLLLAAHVAAAFEPITLGIAIGTASVLTGYLSYTELFCRFAECCREEQPLNASGTAGLAGGARGARGTGPRRRQRPAHRAHPLGQEGARRGLSPDSSLEAVSSGTDSPDREALPEFLLFFFAF